MQRLARSLSLLWAASPQVAAGASERLNLPAMAVSVASVVPGDAGDAEPQGHQQGQLHQRDVKVHFPAPASR